MGRGWAGVAERAGLSGVAGHGGASLGGWMPMGDLDGGLSLDLRWGFALDPLSAVMILVVTGVGFLIHVYSVGYMAHEPDVSRFFVYMNLFMAMMCTLVLGNNLLVMFVGWEGVGLCSYLLIGFWYSDRFNAYCGSKAFIVNRIGDFGFLVGIFLLFSALSSAGVPTLTFREIAEHFDKIAAMTIAVPDWLPWP